MRGLKRLIPLFIALALLLLVWAFGVYQIVITSSSFEPLFYAGDRILIKRTTPAAFVPGSAFLKHHLYASSTPRKGQLIAFSDPRQPGRASTAGTLRLGRCAALAGDTVWLPWHQASGKQPTVPRLYPFVVPGRNITIAIRPWNILLIANTLHLHEGANVCIDCDTALVVDGFSVNKVSFSQDYLWVASAGQSNATDSRTFGFVPCDNIIGRLVALTWSHDTGLPFYKGYRTERFFRPVSALQKALK